MGLLLHGQTLTVFQLPEAQRKLGIIPGAFLPAGGAAGEFLVKLSGANYDTGWAPSPAPVAGRGIVVAGTTVHFAQNADYTAGAIPFATGLTTMGFDAANLFWDDANDFLGIGTAVPDASIDVVRNYATLAFPIGIHARITNSAPANTANPQAAVTVAFTAQGAFQYTLPLETVIGYAAQGRYDGTYAGAGFGCHSVTGGRFTAAKVNSGTVANLFGVRLGVENQFNGGAVDNGFGVFIITPTETPPNGTISTYYGLYVDAPAGTTTYGLFLGTGTGATNYGVYQTGATAFNFFAGHIAIAAATFSATAVVRLQKAYAESGATTTYGYFTRVTETAGALSSGIHHGAYYELNLAGAQNYTNAEGATGLSFAVQHTGSGTLAGLIGVKGAVYKTSTGPVTSAWVFKAFVQNVNATAAIGTAYAYWAATPVVTGAITTYYGLFLSAGAGSTVYGVAQAGTADLNYFAGFSAFGSSSPVNTTFALFGASTAAISSQRILRGSAAYAGTVEGDYWNDFTQHCLTGHIAGVKQFDRRTLFVQTNTVTISNSNAELTLLGTGVGTLTMPANFLTPGKTVKIEIHGHWANTPPNPTLQIRFYAGATLLMDTGAVATPAFTGEEHYVITAWITCQSTGVGGNSASQLFVLSHVGASGAGGVFMPEAVPIVAVLDTTIAKTLNVTAQFSVADPANIIDSHLATVEISA